MYSRITVSSRPTVDTKYPRAQKCCPTKFLFRSPYTRARWIALFPLINPITCDTAYLGGIAIIMCTWSGSRCPSSIFDPTLFLLGQLPQHFPQVPPQFSVQLLPAVLGDKHHMIFALPLRMA